MQALFARKIRADRVIQENQQVKREHFFLWVRFSLAGGAFPRIFRWSRTPFG
jgi:hypothetical protein